MSNTQARRQELTDRAYRVGSEFEQKYGGCAQACFAALQVVLDRREPAADGVFRSLSSMAGGVAGQGDGCCGAYLGGTAFIGYLAGRERENFHEPGEDPLDPAERTRRYGKLCGPSDALATELYQKFIDQYGTAICHSIHRKMYGRPFYNKDGEEYTKFQEAGAYEDDGCPSVVGTTARWVTEILLDNEVIK